MAARYAVVFEGKIFPLWEPPRLSLVFLRLIDPGVHGPMHVITSAEKASRGDGLEPAGGGRTQETEMKIPGTLKALGFLAMASALAMWGGLAAAAPPAPTAAGASIAAEALLAKGGPPPHAPAHGYRAKHQYRYYPGCSVYYDAGRRLWFYIQAGGWTVGASLPTDLQAQLGEYVTIGMDDDTPYVRNADHAAQYPPEKYKQK